MLPLQRCPQGAGRAGAAAVAAADAINAVGGFLNRYIQLAGFLACAAADAFVFIERKPVQGEFVEGPVDGTQGAYVAAERPVDGGGQQDKYQKRQNFPAEIIL
jgi:hypothetical protein